MSQVDPPSAVEDVGVEVPQRPAVSLDVRLVCHAHCFAPAEKVLLLNVDFVAGVAAENAEAGTRLEGPLVAGFDHHVNAAIDAVSGDIHRVHDAQPAQHAGAFRGTACREGVVLFEKQH